MDIYCCNNPISRIDAFGNNWFTIINDTVKNAIQQLVNLINKTSNVVKELLETVDNHMSQQNNFVLANNNKLPIKGKPNSKVTNSKGDTRIYGLDGKALKDIDVSHPHHHPELQNPHEHDWEWDGDKAKRGKPHNFNNIGAKIGVGVGISLGGYAIYRGIRILPSLIPNLWWTIPANAITP